MKATAATATADNVLIAPPEVPEELLVEVPTSAPTALAAWVLDDELPPPTQA